MAEHFMIDLETMITAADAAILSIGIQPFDPRAKGIDEAAGAVVHVDLQACMNAGLRVDASTVMWWMTQTDDARAALVARSPVMLSEALRELTAFGQRNGGWSWAKVWGNGAAFDIPILETAFRRCRLDIPWAYNNVLDVRTMKWIAPDGRRFFAVEREGRRMPLLDGSGEVAFWPKWDGYADRLAPDFARVLKAMDNPEGLKVVAGSRR